MSRMFVPSPARAGTVRHTTLLWQSGPAVHLRAVHLARSKPHTRSCRRCWAPQAAATALETIPGVVKGVEGEDGTILEIESTPVKMDLDLPRRRLQVTFTCNKCGGRTERLVNPLAWNKGTVFLRCGSCDVWHNIRDQAGLIDEVHYNQDSGRAAGDKVDWSGQAELGDAGSTAPPPQAEEATANDTAEKSLDHAVGHGEAPLPMPEDTDCEEDACELDW